MSAARLSPRLVTWVLAMLVLGELVRAATALTGLPGHAPPPRASHNPPHLHRPAGVEVSSIIAAHLFGIAEDAPTQTSSRPPMTAANLLLVGTVATDDPARGIALVAAQGSTSVYRVGDAISEMSLQSVYTDRVILNRNGRLETLALPRLTPGNAGPQAAQASPGNANRAPPRAAPGAPRLGDVMYVQPSIDEQSGDLRGFRVQAGKNRGMLGEAGLKPNDVITAVNGASVAGADREHSQDIINEMLASGSAALTLLRSGQPLEVSVDLAALASNAE